MSKLKVRIAVAVDPKKLEWSSCGWGGTKKEPTDHEKMEFAIEALGADERRYWVEAEIDVEPDPVVIGKSITGD